jgi:3-hydroxyisobutyrate dehydrogenase
MTDQSETDPTTPTVALLGTGTMGAGMARNLAAAGLPLRVWNRTRDKAEPLAEVGATVAGSPAEAVRGADVVVTMLYDADSVASALEEAGEALAEGTVLVQQSTVGVAGSERLGELAGRLGLVYVDAPVLGTKKPAQDGALVVLASGPEDVHERLAPVFDAIGSRTLWVGPAGTASRLKLVANAWVLSVLEGIAQSVSLAQALDLDPRLFLDAVQGGAMDAPYVQLKGKAMLAGDFTPSFSVDGAAKDADLIVAAAESAGAEAAVVDVARHYLRRASDEGHGAEDMAATFLAHRR